MNTNRCLASVLSVALISGLGGCTDSSVGGPSIVEESGPPPIITEFLAKNQAGLTDEDGETSDWIELFNPHLTAIDLGGFHLTDSKNDAKRWTLPAGTMLQPGAYLVVFASGKDRTDPSKPLHTNFSLSSGSASRSCVRDGGEYLALTDKQGSPLPPIWDPYPAQSTDRSYGLLANSTNASVAYFTQPTPGAANNLASALAEQVQFSPPSRAFNGASAITVSLSASSPTATIRYTTNRSRPIGTAGVSGTFAANATTDVCTLNSHGFTSGDLVRVSGPTPLVSTVNYFVEVIDGNSFKLAIEPGGPAIDLTAAGSFTINRDAAIGTAAATDVITTSFAHTFAGPNYAATRLAHIAHVTGCGPGSDRPAAFSHDAEQLHTS